MLSVEEALQKIETHSAVLAPRRVPLGDAAGLVLAEDVTSDINSPPYDKALMDGYAVRSNDREPLRRVLEEIAAGAVPQRAVTPGTASRIMTGAPIPDGADAVIPVEFSEIAGDHTVQLQKVDPPAGQHILRLGTSIRAGDTILRAGVLIRPIEIAILAEVGYTTVLVQPHPRVAILVTGNELVAVGEKPAHGQIRNSNGPMLLSAAIGAGGEVIDLGTARDDRSQLSQAVERGLEADILVLSGGVSAGKFDLVPEVIASLGVEQVFHKVALRPGKPLWFGVKRNDDNDKQTLVFGLPGNPVSSLVCFELFMRPAIAALAGRGFTSAQSVTAQLSHAFDYPGGRAACLPARIVWPARSTDVTPTIEILKWHGSADLATLAQANALARLPVEAIHLEPGDTLEVLPI